jgi:hypothetical protein
VLYPELVYRRFRVAEKWGGYQGEVYGSGPELVVAFTEA